MISSGPVQAACLREDNVPCQLSACDRQSNLARITGTASSVQTTHAFLSDVLRRRTLVVAVLRFVWLFEAFMMFLSCADMNLIRDPGSSP